MQFAAATMFPGDLYEAAHRFAADATTTQAADPGAAWRQAVAMGWPALLVDEARGGAGGTLADLGAVLEGCARHALDLPLVRRCAQAPALLMAAGSPAADAQLRALCAGGADLDLADGSALAATPLAGGGVRLAGTLRGVDAALPSTHVLVATPGHLLLLPRAALPPAATRHAGIDGRRIGDHPVSGLELPAAAVLQTGAAADAAAAAAQGLATLATALEMAAALGASIEHCIAYLTTRVQFGVALATFQVLRHKVVELYVDYEAASVLLARLVADTVASGQLAPRDAALCKLYLNLLARRGAESAIQLHGGMGMTAELPVTRLGRRLLCAEFDQGDRAGLLAQLAAQPTAARA